MSNEIINLIHYNKAIEIVRPYDLDRDTERMLVRDVTRTLTEASRTQWEKDREAVKNDCSLCNGTGQRFVYIKLVFKPIVCHHALTQTNPDLPQGGEK